MPRSKREKSREGTRVQRSSIRGGLPGQNTYVVPVKRDRHKSRSKYDAHGRLIGREAGEARS